MPDLSKQLYDNLMVAGNHLTSFLIQKNAFPNQFKTYEQALEAQGMDYADAWIGWRAILDIRNECEAHNAS